MTDRVRRLEEWPDARLDRLAREHGTPLYVEDLARIRANHARLREAFPDATVKYAAKANAGAHVLRTLTAEGVAVECGSPGELERALAAGADPETAQYTAVNPPEEGLDYACAVAAEHPGLVVTAGAADTVDRLAERGFAGRLLLRVNPGVGAGHHEKVVTGTHSKFGVPADRVPDVLARAADRGLDVRGVHGHVGSGMLDGDLPTYREFCRRMVRFVRESPVDLRTVDLGGGLGVPYRDEEEPVSLDAVAETVREAFADVDVDLVLEPGRIVVADAGVLLARVNTVKPTPGETVVGVDAGMTTLLRPALYDAYHPVAPVGVDADAEGREPVTCSVSGPICESSDVLARERTLPAPARGDLLAVGNAGAYGYEMALAFHSQPRPATVALDGDREGVARERETVADLTRLERSLDWQ
jgi:diaminopimelate decarboxylase